MQSVIFGMVSLTCGRETYHWNLKDTDPFRQNYNHAQSDAFDDHIFPQHHRDMQPGSIAELIKRYADSLESNMARLLTEVGEGKEVNLPDYAFDILVSAAKSDS